MVFSCALHNFAQVAVEFREFVNKTALSVNNQSNFDIIPQEMQIHLVNCRNPNKTWPFIKESRPYNMVNEVKDKYKQIKGLISIPELQNAKNKLKYLPKMSPSD